MRIRDLLQTQCLPSCISLQNKFWQNHSFPNPKYQTCFWSEFPNSSVSAPYLSEFPVDLCPGYIPRKTFKFGGTYGTESTACINEHLNLTQKHQDVMRDVEVSSQALPRLKATKFDPEVRDELNAYQDYLATRKFRLSECWLFSFGKPSAGLRNQ